VPISVGAFAEHFFIFLSTPVWIPQLVCGVETFSSGNIYGSHSCVAH
jgi:hypothetical protein